MDTHELSIGSDRVDEGLGRPGPKVHQFPFEPLARGPTVRQSVFAAAVCLMQQLVEIELVPPRVAARVVAQDGLQARGTGHVGCPHWQYGRTEDTKTLARNGRCSQVGSSEIDINGGWDGA